MTQFTDSPYERMMTQRTITGREAHGPPVYFPGHPCYKCPYGRNTPCLGICYRELLKGRDKTAHKSCDR